MLLAFIQEKIVTWINTDKIELADIRDTYVDFWWGESHWKLELAPEELVKLRSLVPFEHQFRVIEPDKK